MRRLLVLLLPIPLFACASHRAPLPSPVDEPDAATVERRVMSASLAAGVMDGTAMLASGVSQVSGALGQRDACVALAGVDAILSRGASHARIWVATQLMVDTVIPGGRFVASHCDEAGLLSVDISGAVVAVVDNMLSRLDWVDGLYAQALPDDCAGLLWLRAGRESARAVWLPVTAFLRGDTSDLVYDEAVVPLSTCVAPVPSPPSGATTQV